MKMKKKRNIFLAAVILLFMAMVPNYYVSAQADVTPPKFKSVSIDNPNPAVGDTVTFTVEATDESGILLSGGNTFISFKPPISNKISYIYLSNENGKLVGRRTITSEDESGLWKINMIALRDNAGNEAYIRNGQHDMSAADFFIGPVITIAPYEQQPTHKSIIVTASVINGVLNETSHTFKENGSFDFIAIDSANNKVTQTVTISNIDKTSPTITAEDKEMKATDSLSETFLLSGVTANDTLDGNLTAQVQISNMDVVQKAYETARIPMETEADSLAHPEVATIAYTVINSGDIIGKKDVQLKIFHSFKTASVRSIVIKTSPTKVNYLVGQTLDLAGGTIESIWNDGTTEIKNMTDEGVTVTGYDSSQEGTQTITITYGGQTATFEITVAKKADTFDLGDINADKAINASDALQALRHSVGEIKLEGDAFIRGDVTKDTFINASDALQILRYSVKEITVF